MASSSSTGDDHRRDDDDVIKKRQQYVILASEAAKAKRYSDQVDCMREVARLHVPLTHEERCLLWNGYRHMVEPRRFAWKYLSKMNQSEGIITELKRLEEKISEMCEQFFNVADEHLIPHDTHGESIVDYNTLKGDFYRYLAEVKTGFERNDAVDMSQKAYEAAIRVADVELSAADQFRLCAYVNLCILCSQFQDKPERAISLATKAHTDAMLDNKPLSESSHTCLQLLKDMLESLKCRILGDGGYRSYAILLYWSNMERIR